MHYGEAGQSHLLPFLGAAALFAALTITAHSVVLGLAAVIAGPVPAAQTALSLSRKAVSGAAQEEAASVAEAAPESTGTAASQPEAAAPTGGIESYLVELLGDDARPEGAGAVIEKNYPQGSGEKYVACGAGSIKNNTRQTAADIAAEIQDPLPFGVEKDSPDPQILIMHTHATEDYRLSAGLWYSPGDGARTTDTNLNMCAVGRVICKAPSTPPGWAPSDRTLNDYPQLHRRLREQPGRRPAVLGPVPQHQGSAAGRPPDAPSRARAVPGWPQSAPWAGGGPRESR